jgi:hypothetical protein
MGISGAERKAESAIVANTTGNSTTDVTSIAVVYRTWCFFSRCAGMYLRKYIRREGVSNRRAERPWRQQDRPGRTTAVGLYAHLCSKQQLVDKVIGAVVDKGHQQEANH